VVVSLPVNKDVVEHCPSKELKNSRPMSARGVKPTQALKGTPCVHILLRTHLCVSV